MEESNKQLSLVFWWICRQSAHPSEGVASLTAHELSWTRVETVTCTMLQWPLIYVGISCILRTTLEYIPWKVGNRKRGEIGSPYIYIYTRWTRGEVHIDEHRKGTGRWVGIYNFLVSVHLMLNAFAIYVYLTLKKTKIMCILSCPLIEIPYN